MFDYMNEYDHVEEGFFANPEQSVSDLLDAVRSSVSAKINTLEEADEMLGKLTNEAAKFNDVLISMSSAYTDFKAGNISKEDMLSICSVGANELKSNCTALGLCPNDIVTNDDICEDEIAILKEFIVSCAAIVEERKSEIMNYEGSDQAGKAGTVINAAEGLLYQMSMESVTDGKVAMQIRKSTEVKTANAMYKQGKKLYSIGSKDKATATIKKAQALYQKALDKVKKETEGIIVERTSSIPGTRDKYKDNLRRTTGAAMVITYLEDRIDSCRALLLQWSNKAGKATFKETKASLKAERKEEKVAQKEARKAARGERRANRAAEKEAKRAAKAAEGYFDDDLDMYAFEGELDIDFDEYESYDEALESITIETGAQEMLIQDGFADELV